MLQQSPILSSSQRTWGNKKEEDTDTYRKREDSMRTMPHAHPTFIAPTTLRLYDDQYFGQYLTFVPVSVPTLSALGWFLSLNSENRTEDLPKPYNRRLHQHYLSLFGSFRCCGWRSVEMAWEAYVRIWYMFASRPKILHAGCNNLII